MKWQDEESQPLRVNDDDDDAAAFALPSPMPILKNQKSNQK
jgi:hypothetical protein